jgi:hypothetical protein
MLRLAEAQTRNSLLRGEELNAAASTAAEVATRQRARLIAGDGAGERIIGAALSVLPAECLPANLAQRFDGQSLLLVSGVIAGPAGLAQAAARLRSLGARAVHAAVLGGWSEPIPDIETITTLGAAYRCAPAHITAA